MTQPSTFQDATPSASDPRNTFIETFQREHATTMKILRAFPADQAAFKPHERSNSALQLAWTFLVEERLMLLALRDGEVLGSGFPPVPESWEAALAQLEAQYAEVLALLRSADAAVFGRTVKFPGGPKQLADYPIADFLWFMLFDQIHHRGQLSVYVRMVGAKLPSIYGPTADEPWT